MNKLFVLLLSVFIMASCGKDEKACSDDDYIGSYTGENKCGSDSEMITANISAGANDDEVVYMDTSGSEVTMQLDGCNFTIPKEVDPFFGAEISGNGSLDGDVLTVNISVSIFGFTETCTATLQRQ